MDLTTRARVKEWLDLTEATKDTFIDNLIKMVSQSVELYLNRHVEEKARTELYDVEPGQQRIYLRGYPVLDPPAPLFKNDTARQFGAGILEISEDSFHLDLNSGEADFDRIRLIRGPGVFQAIYTGGMADTTVNFITKFPDVAMAVDMQVAFNYKRRENLGLTSFSAEGGSISFESPGNLIAGVKKTLQRHRRIRGGH